MTYHLLNFFAPALWMAVSLPTVARLVWRGGKPHLAWYQQVGIHLLLGSGVLMAGLLLLERDGAMLTYGALVVTTALAQWGMLRRV